MVQLGFVLNDPRLTFWSMIRYTAQEYAAARGAGLLVRSGTTVPEQQAAIYDLVQHNVAALLLGPCASHGLAAAIQHATAAHIPVIVVDTEVVDTPVACTVHADNLAGAELAGRYLMNRLGGRGKIMHLQGPLTSQNSVARARGLHRALDDFPGVRIVYEARSATWDRDLAAQTTRKALRTINAVQAIVTANDMLALGVVDALDEAAHTGPVMVVSFDALPEALLAVQAGKMTATVHQSPRALAREAVDAALALLAGQAVPATRLVDVSLVTADNLADAALDTLHNVPGMLRAIEEASTLLRSERTLLHTMINALPDTHVFVKDQAGQIVVANTAYSALLGCASPAEVVGKTVEDFLPPALAQANHREDQRVIATGTPISDQVEELPDRSGQLHWYLTTRVPLHDAGGNVVGIVGLRRDITGLKRAEQERIQLQANLIELQEQALRELSAPLIPLSDRVVVMPLLGTLDRLRVAYILEALPAGVAAHAAELVILDLTGVHDVAIDVAADLARGVQAVRLLGARVMLTGTPPAIARALVEAHIDLRDVLLQSTLQRGIALALGDPNHARR